MESFIRRIRELGYLIKLDTNGYRPKVLGHLLDRGLLDYVAMDIKASRERYGIACGLPDMELAMRRNTGRRSWPGLSVCRKSI